MSRFVSVFVWLLWVVLVIVSAYVNRWVAVGLASAAVVISFARLIYLMNALDFPWPWRRRGRHTAASIRSHPAWDEPDADPLGDILEAAERARAEGP